MEHKLGKRSYRLTSRKHRMRTFGGKVTCSECEEMYRGDYYKYNPVCPECLRKKEQGPLKLGRRQQLYVDYLIKLVKRQDELINERGSGIDGIATMNDIHSLEWRILEYRRLRIMQRLGMKEKTPLEKHRKHARLAVKLMNEIQEFNFSMMWRDES